MVLDSPAHAVRVWCGAALVLATALCPSCTSEPPSPAVARPADDDWFTDEAATSGLDFVHVNGMSGKRYLAEIMAPGVGLIDYDNDGDLDVYLVQGQALGPGDGRADRSPAIRDRLYRNDLRVQPDGTRTLKFTDVTAQAGLPTGSYGMGVAAGDFDNDGRMDLYLTRLGTDDALLKNLGDGRFVDVSKDAGIHDPGWTVPASFFDFDRDGWLDLYVGSYVQYNLEHEVQCVGPTGSPDYCSPRSYRSLPGRLYRNRRDGTFDDVTVSSRVATEYGPALGAVAFDANRDGWPDLYVANDGAVDQLWLNRRDGTFENTAVIAGVAVNASGKATGSMGVDAADFDRDGDDDLIVANLAGEGNSLFANDGAGTFTDVASVTGLRQASLGNTGFGAAWVDIDNDGLIDVVTINGAIQVVPALARAGDPFPLDQRKQILRNTGAVRFEDVTERGGAALRTLDVGRGAAFGDIDNDGDVDVLVGVNNGRVQLLINRRGQHMHWLGLRAVGRSGRDMLGARAQIVRRDGSSEWRRFRSDGSYASANDPRVVVGLGDSTAVAAVRVHWPGGGVEEWPPRVDEWQTLQEGTGK